MKISFWWDGTQRLDKIVDVSKAKELILTARALKAQTHFTWT